MVVNLFRLAVPIFDAPLRCGAACSRLTALHFLRVFQLLIAVARARVGGEPLRMTILLQDADDLSHSKVGVEDERARVERKERDDIRDGEQTDGIEKDHCPLQERHGCARMTVSTAQRKMARSLAAHHCTRGR